ncbi:MAG: GNAT family N-acetyltransferase [Firmicutes bacterium]|nr:GNAT family N-acetyltransferase [Bacillota bacterium]
MSWGLSWGVYRDGRLASATDAPDVPFMKDVVVEMGINTLPEYPRQGLAKTVTGALIKYLLERGRVPLWSCSSDKFASQGLAASLGFVRFADVIAVTLD